MFNNDNMSEMLDYMGGKLNFINAHHVANIVNPDTVQFSFTKNPTLSRLLGGTQSSISFNAMVSLIKESIEADVTTQLRNIRPVISLSRREYKISNVITGSMQDYEEFACGLIQDHIFLSNANTIVVDNGVCPHIMLDNTYDFNSPMTKLPTFDYGGNLVNMPHKHMYFIANINLGSPKSNYNHAANRIYMPEKELYTIELQNIRDLSNNDTYSCEITYKATVGKVTCMEIEK